jgi:hypothetical protein
MKPTLHGGYGHLATGQIERTLRYTKNRKVFHGREYSRSGRVLRQGLTSDRTEARGAGRRVRSPRVEELTAG